MLDFYETVPVSDCTSEDADMLLFQWGTYDRAFLPRIDGTGGTGVVFEINLVRQLIPDVQADDDDIWQLELAFELEPTAALRALGIGNRWCPSSAALREFRDFVLTSPALKACSELPVRRRMLEYVCCG
jgi:hypothetical protein